MENTLLTEIMVLREKNAELVEMLETILNDYNNIIPQSPARDNRINQIESLINSNITK